MPCRWRRSPPAPSRRKGRAKQTMVDQDLEYFQKKFSKINRIRTSFVQLTQQITAKINELVQRDQELANQLKGALT